MSGTRMLYRLYETESGGQRELGLDDDPEHLKRFYQ